MNLLKRWLPGILIIGIGLAMLYHGPIAQLPHYHEFADVRALAGIPHAADVLSNAGFMLVGLWGLQRIGRSRSHFSNDTARASYLAFMVALALTAIGSGYYHLHPDNDRLLWDRLPIALACASLLSGAYAETHERSPTWLLPILLAIAIFSVAWWYVTDAASIGDLRPYLLLQGAPLILIPLWQWAAGASRRRRFSFGIAILLYVLAKVCEIHDHDLFRMFGAISGHTLKHLLATTASAVLAAEWLGSQGLLKNTRVRCAQSE